MWRIGVCAIVVLAALVVRFATPTGDAAGESNLVIRTGRAIGKFELGMTQQRLLQVAGRPRYVVQRGSSFGQRTVEYQYGFGAEFIAILFGRPGRMRVVEVSTTVRRERTPRGIGTGSRESALRRAYPSIRCETLTPPPPPGIPPRNTPYVVHDRDCTLFSGRGARTVFKTAVPDKRGVTAAQYLRRAVVVEVLVSSRRPDDNPWGP
jgi:hypothetical protein